MTIPRSGHFLSDVIGAAVMRDVLAELDTLGFDTIWTSETIGRDIVSSMTAVALETQRSMIGAGIVPIWHRHPFEVAMAAASIDDFSGGRFRLGLGISHPPFVASYGMRIERPLQYVREFLEVLQPLLDGETVDFTGERIRAMGRPLPIEGYTGDVPVYLAGLMPGMCRLAGELADGVFLYMATPEWVARVREWVAEGAAAAGRPAAAVEILVATPTVVDDDRDAARDDARFFLRKYLTMPSYRRIVVEQGLGDEADCRDMPDGLVEALVALGTPADVAARVAEFEAAGATHVVHSTVHSRPERYLPTLRAVAPSRD